MAIQKKTTTRQAWRKALILLAFLLFPVVLNYLSPYVIIDGAFQGIINGSFIVFGGMLISSLFVGRLWCGWLCPAAGLQEACFAVNSKPVKNGKGNWIKWGIWVVWLGVITFGVINAGGYKTVNFFHLTEAGISVSAPQNYFIYYIVLGTIFLLSITVGRRSFCHHACWMAPFMIGGRKLVNTANLPTLRLVADKAKCTNCKTCTKGCPMSLDVNAMVQAGNMENPECILCGNCIDTCPSKVIRYAFVRRK